jgi:light-harvesting protein B-800-850 alpha chain
MIYGKLWCVVKPSTGIPLFLSAVAVSSFLVHYMLLTHTSWLPKYYEGKATPKTAAVEQVDKVAATPTDTIVAAAKQ